MWTRTKTGSAKGGWKIRKKSEVSVLFFTVLASTSTSFFFICLLADKSLGSDYINMHWTGRHWYIDGTLHCIKQLINKTKNKIIKKDIEKIMINKIKLVA